MAIPHRLVWIVTIGMILTMQLPTVSAQDTVHANKAPLGADDAKSGFRIAAWNIEHLGNSGESCLERSEEDFEALRSYAKLLNADLVAIQEVESLESIRRIFTPDEYDVVLAERAFDGERPLCWMVPSRVERAPRYLGNHFTGFAIRKGVEYQSHPPVTEVGNLDEAGGHASYASDITVQTPTGPMRLLSVHLNWGCSDFAEAIGPKCQAVINQASAINRWLADRNDEGSDYAVLGDFNHAWEPASPYWRTMFGLDFRSSGFATSAENLLAFCPISSRPAPAVGRRPLIDHVFLFGDVATSASFGQLEFVDYDQRNFKLSDHCPVFAEIRAE